MMLSVMNMIPVDRETASASAHEKLFSDVIRGSTAKRAALLTQSTHRQEKRLTTGIVAGGGTVAVDRQSWTLALGRKGRRDHLLKGLFTRCAK